MLDTTIHLPTGQPYKVRLIDPPLAKGQEKSGASGQGLAVGQQDKTWCECLAARNLFSYWRYVFLASLRPP